MGFFVLSHLVGNHTSTHIAIHTQREANLHVIMFRKATIHFCSSSSTLSGRLASIAAKVTSADAASAPGVWSELSHTLKQAAGLRETDTALTIGNYLLSKDLFPSVEVWLELIDAAAFADIEAKTVLTYKGALRSRPCSIWKERKGEPRADRDLLIMTGGVVPLTQRNFVSSGKAFLPILQAWRRMVGEGHVLNDDMCNALLRAAEKNSDSLSVEALKEISIFVVRATENPDIDSKLFQLLESVEMSQNANDQGKGIIAAVAMASAVYPTDEVLNTFLAVERMFRVVSLVKKCYRSPMVGIRESLEKMIVNLDRGLQRNSNDGNPLQIDEDTEGLVRRAAQCAIVRCLRVDLPPAEFLEKLRQIASAEPAASVWSEYEAICGYRELMKDKELTSTQREDILNNMLVSLRTMVDVRPRGDAMDADTKALYQHGHAIVIEALCSTRDSAHISKAYLVVVAHKYHNLSIDVALIRPLVEAMSRRGDCRVFNLIDLVTLYCNNAVDFETINSLFRACQVAGDHHRAKSLYSMLKAVIPGFLVKAPSEVTQNLVELKVLPQQGGNMFDPDDERVPAALAVA